MGADYRREILEPNGSRDADELVLGKTRLLFEDPAEAVFSRDLLEVDILHPSNGSRLFTVFNNHLKSQFVPFGEDPVAGKEANDTRRRRQAGFDAGALPDFDGDRLETLADAFGCQRIWNGKETFRASATSWATLAA